jgi:carboxymethylenebutenolidase
VLLQVGSDNDLGPVADLFAEEGYVAMTADLPGDLAGDKFDAERGLAYLSAVLQARPVSAGKVGVIGFGAGGLLAYLAASRLPIDAAAAFDAPDLDRQQQTDPELRCPLVVQFGTHERSTAAAAAKVRAALSRSGDLAVFEYADASPGFYLPDHANFQHLAAQLAHSRTIALLRRTLGLSYDLESLWDAHLNWEFVKVDAEGTMTTMVAEPVNLNVPVLTGGIGQEGVLRYYNTQFLGQMPKDSRLVQISRIIGADRVVDEHLLCFTHDRAMDAMLPGIPPTG